MTTATGEYRKPLPVLHDLNRPFWEAAKAGRLEMQSCRACGHIWYPIGPACPRCLSQEFGWKPLSGRGTVLSWVVFHQVYDKSFADDVPYNVVLVQLDEGPRMFSNIVDSDNDDIEVGMAVEVTFDHVTEEIAIPRFRRA
jgi:uncharacterized protein